MEPFNSLNAIVDYSYSNMGNAPPLPYNHKNKLPTGRNKVSNRNRPQRPRLLGDKFKTWLFDHRWSLWVWMLLGAISTFLGFLFLQFHDCYMTNPLYDNAHFPWTIALPFIGWHIGLFVWFIRDQVKERERDQKERDQQQKEIDQKYKERELEQADFHKFQEWAATSDEQKIALRVGSIHSLGPFLGKQQFCGPTKEILLAIVRNFQKDATDKGELTVWNAVIRVFNAHRGLVGADLREALLDGAYLCGANLAEADLSNADLAGIILDRADLRNACLNGANLASANLANANLSGATLKGAYLFNANLSKANLTGADLTGADLNGADMTGADLSETILEFIRNWKKIQSIANTRIVDLKNPPLDFKEWARDNGAEDKLQFWY